MTICHECVIIVYSNLKKPKRDDTVKNIYKCSNGIILVIPDGANIDIELIVTAKRMKNPLEDLTNRQREVIDMVINGASNKLIANELFLSLGTVKRVIYNAYNILGVKSRGELIHLLMFNDLS